MSVLAILDEGPAYGLQLRNEFEERTGGIWPLNVGQVYTTIDRLERDGLVRMVGEPGPEGQKTYEITRGGRKRLAEWLSEPTQRGTPPRDELVLKLIMAADRRSPAAVEVIQTERRAAVELLQEYTRLKRDASPEAELGWMFLLDSLIFQAEARIRWLDVCEARLSRASSEARRRRAAARPSRDRNEVRA